MTSIVSSGALNSTHSLTQVDRSNYYSDEARHINFYAHVGYFKCHLELK